MLPNTVFRILIFNIYVSSERKFLISCVLVLPEGWCFRALSCLRFLCPAGGDLALSEKFFGSQPGEDVNSWN